jgi:ABC-type dipeptide/oligopeptide/nickel transport system permease subunit
MSATRTLVLIILVCLCIVFVFPLVAPYSPLQIDAAGALPPSLRHPFGTDALGRDVLSRFLHGGQRTLLITLFSMLIALSAGVSLGLLSGYFSGWPDTAIISVFNAMLALPGLFLALIVVTLFGQGMFAVGLAIGIAQIAPVGQLTRTVVRTIRNEPYILSAVAIGATRFRILWREVLANAMPTLLSYASVTFAYCLLNVAAFGYLGLISQLEIPEWGRMLAEGREVYREAIWVSIAPGIALTLLVMMANALADRLSQTNLRG